MLDFRNDLHRRLADPTKKGIVDDARMWGDADGHQAMRFLRDNASELGIDAARIGISGFSAGGAVAMGAAIEHDENTKPDFAVAIYPGYRLEKPVPADAPPIFA